MAKGYWIAHVDVSDPEAYKSYLSANAIAFAKYFRHIAERNHRVPGASGE